MQSKINKSPTWSFYSCCLFESVFEMPLHAHYDPQMFEVKIGFIYLKIQQGCIKLIKSDSKDIYNVPKDICLI